MSTIGLGQNENENQIIPDNAGLAKTPQSIFNEDENIQRWCLYDITVSAIVVPFGPTIVIQYLSEAYYRYTCSTWPDAVCGSDLKINDSYVGEYSFNFSVFGIETDIGGLVWISILSSLVLQTFFLFLVTPASDYENYANSMFKWNAGFLLASLATGLLIGITYSLWWVLIIQFIFMNLFYIISNVIYDGFLPNLVKVNPVMQQLAEAHGVDSDEYNDVSKSVYNLSLGTAFTRGYFASILCFVLYFILEIVMSVPDMRSHTNDYKMVVITIFVMVLYSYGMYEVVYKIREAEGEHWTNYSDYFKGDNMGCNFVCKLCEFPELGFLLLAWFFLSDITESAGIYMQLLWINYRVPTADYNPILGVGLLMLPIGTIFFTYLREAYQIPYITMLKYILLVNLFVFGIAYFFIVDFLLPMSWVCTVIYMFSVGAFQTFAKAAVSYITPKKYLGSVFSLMEISNKGSSYLSPICHFILETQAAKYNDKSILAYGCIFYLVLYVVSYTCFSMFDLEDGRNRKVKFEQAEQGGNNEFDVIQSKTLNEYNFDDNKKEKEIV